MTFLQIKLRPDNYAPGGASGRGSGTTRHRQAELLP